MNIAKRVIFIFCLMLCAISGIIYAEFNGNYSIITDKTELEKGEEFSITVKVNCSIVDYHEVVTASRVIYDKSVLEYLGVEQVGDIRVESSLFDETGYIYTHGKINSNEKIVLYIIKFRVKDEENIPDKTKIVFDDIIVTDGGEDVVFTNLGDSVLNFTINNEEEQSPDHSMEPTIQPNNTPEISDDVNATPSTEESTQNIITNVEKVTPYDVDNTNDKSNQEDEKNENDQFDIKTGEDYSPVNRIIIVCVLIFVVIIILIIKKYGKITLKKI